ncbi:uncharacterized protein BDZ99DRAFT_514110 [Mytilinidion resinicola]|uniref:Uncharacterized protein n=1 Tax=Mytilinidion resinicola TaxID=574789 RepID=A0A6A6ZAM4_9PEZI|nr:uncharacterized protein BDZ99DRAFT_514110 [Mytilinidion resinicola]KAF2817888.1 hypothetical protein BDZ99DRAFT_514110 [Mytilinidion resinicola]
MTITIFPRPSLVPATLNYRRHLGTPDAGTITACATCILLRARTHHQLLSHRLSPINTLVTGTLQKFKIVQIGRKKMALDHVGSQNLKHGAAELFEDDGTDHDIRYDNASIDMLFDRARLRTLRRTKTTLQSRSSVSPELQPAPLPDVSARDSRLDVCLKRIENKVKASWQAHEARQNDQDFMTFEDGENLDAEFRALASVLPIGALESDFGESEEDAEVWANDQGALLKNIEAPDKTPPDPSVWEKILEEREATRAAEVLARAEAFSRGKRAWMATISYSVNEQDVESI